MIPDRTPWRAFVVLCAIVSGCTWIGVGDDCGEVACDDPPAAMCADGDGSACIDDDPCAAAGECQGGVCVALPIDDGAPCDGRQGVCLSGACVDCIEAIHCDDLNACTVDTCEGGVCAYEPLSAVDCEDGDLCTLDDTCDQGVCVGGDPVTCTALGACHDVGTCDSATGLCSDPPKPEASRCDDEDACTYDDQCDGAGTCGGTFAACVSTDCRIETCNGTATCAVQNVDVGTVCGANCQECNGSGVCTGGCVGGETCCEPGWGDAGCFGGGCP